MEIEDLLKSPSRTKGREATEGVIPGKFALSVGKPMLPTPSGWKWTKLCDVARLESGHTPSRKYPEYWDGDIPWIGIKDAVDNHGRTITDTYQHITALGLENSAARLLPKNTVCLSRTASVGYITVMGKSMATSQDFVNWVCSNEIESQYLKFILIAERESLWQFASGTTHQTIYYPEVKAFHVCLPPIEEQRSIVNIVGTLDRKIENLRKQNETLERIAQTLFKHWFVDFEFPNEDGKPYKSSGGEMVRSELGEIPAGWRVGKLGNEFDISIGRTPPRQESEWFSRDSKNVKWVSIRDMGSCGTYILETSEYLTKEAVSKFGIPIIPENTVILSFKLTVGRVAITTDSMLSNEAIAHVKVSSDSPTSEYIYLFLSQFNFNKLGSTSSIATAVNSKSIKGIEFLVPAKKVASGFSHIINPLFSKLRVNTQQIQTLIKARDLLLPKLMSGKLRITE
jgi:type I restriction enzyme S subunit